MAELTSKERLQPSLLDRLTDDQPSNRRESAEKRVLTLTRLRECVRRDLAFLFNATHLATVQDLAGHPEVERSTLNYGIPDLAGRPASSIDRAALARSVRRAILDFEPRLIRSTLTVDVVVEPGEPTEHGANALRFDIRADLWAEPVPLCLHLRTDLDLEDGEARVTEGTSE